MSRERLTNDALLTQIGVDTADNERRKGKKRYLMEEPVGDKATLVSCHKGRREHLEIHGLNRPYIVEKCRRLAGMRMTNLSSTGNSRTFVSFLCPLRIETLHSLRL